MAKVDAKITQALVVTFKSLVKEEELPKNASNLPFFGDVVKTKGGAHITYKPVKRSDGSTELHPLTVMWTDNGVDYFIDLMDAGYDK